MNVNLPGLSFLPAEYPSRKAFVEIATSKEVAEIGVHRAAGLEGQWLLATTTRTA